ncbi:Serine/threonine-protein kinase PrkC [Stieleria neptunia]|uniref:Serine/threonine-protein kinase PrkC n=1 Tax=Stieleria neptunia TaxID=2527979 RepID=A0A518HKK8_9BACT|nr:protein kinase [Stieleria neptunia]QDV41373.1 Serine/threonine-protein kinase PrkC [Stieleria neptunia]
MSGTFQQGADQQSADRQDEIIGKIADSYLADCRAGNACPIEPFVQRYPEWADELRELLPTLALVEQVKLPEQDDATISSRSAAPSLSGKTLGDYQLVRELGQGGMGIVYEAEQISLGRRVAIKVLPPNAGFSAHQKLRFEREAKAAAKLHHTNIVPVFGVGEDDGISYYVMQFIRGQGLDEVLRELESLPDHPSASAQSGAMYRSDRSDRVTRSTVDSSVSSASIHPYWINVAQIGLQVSDALAYAHAQGITHRDIKPSNLLLDVHNDVWVADFGLAKSEDDANITRSGDILGTIRYMPPEAFTSETDARGDVYSLGITLYELVTLKPAFDESDRRELIQRVVSPRPVLLDRNSTGVPRDLATIVEKAIERAAKDRYQTAEAMHEDLRRFLADEPILARRASLAERCGRWARQNRGFAASIAATIMMLVVLTIIGFSSAYYFFEQQDVQRKLNQQTQSMATANEQLLGELQSALEQSTAATASAERARRRAEQQSELTRRSLYSASMLNAIDSMDEHRGYARAQNLLDQWRPASESDIDRRDWEWYYAQAFCNQQEYSLESHRGALHGLALNGDQSYLASAGTDGWINIWEIDSRTIVKRIVSPVGPLNCVTWEPAGPARLAVGGQKGMAVFDTETWEVVYQTEKPLTVRALQWSPDGRYIARRGRWSAVSNAEESGDFCLLETDRFQVASTLHGWPGYADQFAMEMGWSADSRRVAYPSGKAAMVWDLATDSKQFQSPAAFSDLRSVRFHPTSPDQIIACGRGGTARILDLKSEEINMELAEHTHAIASLTADANGNRLATASWDGTIRIWDTETGSLRRTVHGHSRHVFKVVWDHRRDRIFSAGMDGAIKCWQPEGSHCRREFTLNANWLNDLAVSPDGGLIACAAGNRRVFLVDAVDGKVVHRFRKANTLWNGVDYSPCGTRLVAAGGIGRPDEPGRLCLWDTPSGDLLFEQTTESKINDVAFHPEGHSIAAGGSDGSIDLFDHELNPIEGPTATRFTSIQSLSWSADGGRLAIAGLGGGLGVWDSKTGQLRYWPGTTELIYTIAWSRSGEQIAVSTSSNLVMVIDATTLQPIFELPAQLEAVTTVNWGPSDRRLLTIDARGTFLLWDPISRHPTLRMSAGRGNVRAAQWSEDGSKIIASSGKRVVIWDASKGYATEASRLTK